MRKCVHSRLLRLAALVYIGYQAYDIRLYAIKEYGRVIHEVPNPVPADM